MSTKDEDYVKSSSINVKIRAYSDGYDSQEDIERLVRISIVDDKSNFIDSNKLTYDTNHLKIEKNIDKSSFELLRFLNILSILFLLVTFFSTSISRINNHNDYLLMEYFQRDKIEAETNLIVLYIAFFFVTMSLMSALLRNLIVVKEKDFSHQDIQTVISIHFKHFYYLGNILFALCLVANHTKDLEKYGVNLIFCLITLIIYFKAYHSHKIKILNVKLKNLFNHFSFSVNISFLLAWNVCYLTICIASLLSHFEIESSTKGIINISLQSLLCAFVVLSLSYFYDLYFSFIVLIFQIGNTLNKNLFNFNIEDLKKDSNIGLILTGFTILCFIYGLIYIPQMKNTQYTEDLEEMNKNYIEDKINN